jgi:HD superfamily phosphodiesterase
MTMIEPPQTSVADLIERLSAATAPAVVAHSQRSYQFAAMAARTDGVELDGEALYLGVVLHDVGLAELFDGDERFEVRGANGVRSALLNLGFEKSRAELVWDIIALHATTGIARHKSPETRYANRGIAMDVRGAGADALDPVDVRAVLDRWPRAAFPKDFEALLAIEVQKHPETTRFSWLESVAIEHVTGFQARPFLDALHASSSFH